MSVFKSSEKAAVNLDSHSTFHIDFSRELYQKVLAGDLGNYFQKQLEANGEGLRISLQFDDSASVAALPWEFLHDGEGFLVVRRRTLLSRMPFKAHRIQSKPLESILRFFWLFFLAFRQNLPVNCSKNLFSIAASLFNSQPVLFKVTKKIWLYKLFFKI